MTVSDKVEPNKLLIHTGLRPGELIIGHADRSDIVFLPAGQLPYRFTIVKNTDQPEWAISRTQIGSGQIEPILTFSSFEDAEHAVKEIHQALLEPAPEVIRPFNIPQEWKAPLAILGGILFLFLMGLAFKSPSTQSTPAATTSVNQSSQTEPTQGLSVGGRNDTYISPTAAPEPMPATPGESLLQQIGGGSYAPPAPAAPAAVQLPPTQQQPPATAGDGLLNQIQGR